MYHIFFFHVSVNEYLDCFNLLAILNNTANLSYFHCVFKIYYLKNLFIWLHQS